MKSRLNQLNKRIAPQRWVVVDYVGPFGNRVPPTTVPWPTLGQPDRRQPTPTNHPALLQRIDGVLTTRRGEPARGRAQGRDHRSVQLDEIDEATDDRPRTPDAAHRAAPERPRVRRSAVRSSCSNRAEIA